MKALKSARIVAASLGVLAFGALAASPAMAFDNLEWNWQKDVKEKVDIDVYIDVDVESTGLVEVEKLQIFLGDVEAYNYVAHIYNNPFYEGAGHYDDYYSYDPKKKDPRPVYTAGFKTPEICIFRGKNGCGGGYDDHDKNSDWDKLPVKPLDARYELPIVLASAQAIGNNQSITSDVPVFLHDGQFLADTKNFYRDGGWDVESLAAAMPASTEYKSRCWKDCGPDGNLHTDLAVLFTLAAGFGLLKHSDIYAQSTVYDLKNVSVDNSSTAVGNNISVDLASDVDGGTNCNTGCKDRLSNHVVIADITQFALANVTANTSTTYVSATGYDHMRQLETKTLSTKEGDPGFTISVPTPWVSSTATAVGNNVSINVGRNLTP